MSALAQIIRTSMHHNRASEDALGPNQLDVLVRHRAFGVALTIGLDISQITHVALGVPRCAMGFAERVEVGPGAGAAVGVVAELVDVHAALGGGVVAGDVVGDGRVGGLGGLLEGHGSTDFGVTADHCDCGEKDGQQLLTQSGV